MTRLLLIALCLLPLSAHADPAHSDPAGKRGLLQVKQCIMTNDMQLCHKYMTPDSYEVFDRFASYKLMPCLPTDFTYESEHAAGNNITVKATMPADNRNSYVFRLVFLNGADVKLNLPETLRTGLGENWRDKLNLTEQLFLMMQANMQGKVTCDMIWNLAKPSGRN